MAKITRTASGKYTTIGFRIEADGKRKRKRFTFSDKATVKAECAAWEAGGKSEDSPMDITVGEAMKRYTDSKENTLSPSTIRNYRQIIKNGLPALKDVKLGDLTKEMVQNAVNAEAKTLSSKTVKNDYALFTATMKMFYEDFRPNISLPAKQTFHANVPSDEQIANLLRLAKGKDVEIPIMLAAMGSLRISEISALQVQDITDQGVNVNKTHVIDQHGKLLVKNNPKTKAGERFSYLPKEVIDKIKATTQDKSATDSLCGLTPTLIYQHFKALCKECGMEKCRFHDLRHYYASMAHLLGVPDQYIMKYGGWSDKGTLTKIYQQAQEDHLEEESKKITSFFGDMVSKI